MIELLKETDLESLCDLENLCFSAPWTLDQFKYEFNENPYSTILVIKDENKVIGYIDYWITFDTATIAKIAVKKEYRRNHYASMLLHKAFEHMKKEEVFSVTLEVRKSNEAAYKFYEKSGFKKVTLKEGYYDDGEDAIYMVKVGV